MSVNAVISSDELKRPGSIDDPASPQPDRTPSRSRAALLIPLAILAMRASTLACKLGLALFVGRYLDLSSLGIYGLVTGAVAIGPVVVGLGMVHVIMRDAVILPLDQLTGHLRHYWLFSLSIYVVMLALVSVTSLAGGVPWVIALVIAIMLFEHAGNDVFQLLSNLERPMLANVTAFLRGCAWILIYVPIAVWDPSFRSLPSLFGFWLAGSAVAVLLFAWASREWPWKAAFKLPFEFSWIKARIKSAYLVYISDLSFVASQNLDRYIVTAFLGLQVAGIYFLYWAAANAVSQFVSITVLQIQRPRLIRAFHEGGLAAHRQLVSRCMKSTISASVVFSVIVAGAFCLVVPVLNKPVFAVNLGAFGLIMLGMAVRNFADSGAMALFTARRDYLMTLTNVAAVVALVIAQVMLLPFAGLYGAGAAILIAFSAIAVWRHRLLFG